MERLIPELYYNKETPIFKQIKTYVETSIKNGILKSGDKLPSINKLTKEFNLAPGTVIRAYEELKELGIVSSKQGQGYFISSEDISLNYRIFLLFDRMTAYKEILYDSIRNEFDDTADIQVFFHHYNYTRFNKLVRENFGKFSHYVLMPHLNNNIQKVINKIPEKKIVFIDNLPKRTYTNSKAVYQDFKNDIYNALTNVLKKIRKYGAINLSLSLSHFQFVPEDIKTGFNLFGKNYNLCYSILDTLTSNNLRKNELYIIFNDTELILALKIIQQRKWKLGEDIGIISFDETPMKEILAGGISVLSTDFVKMGLTAANLVKGKVDGQIVNPFYLIERNSF